MTIPLSPNPWGDRRRRRVGLLGGSFNPAHGGHRHIVDAALKFVDEVWLLVSPQNPLKPVAGMAPLAERLRTARAVMGGHPRIRVTALESRLGTRFTVHTLAVLKVRFPGVRFVWLMGGDNLVQISRWARWTRIFAAVPVAVMARSPYCHKALAGKAARRLAGFRAASPRGLADRPPPAWVFLHIRLHPASATAIRAQTTKETSS